MTPNCREHAPDFQRVLPNTNHYCFINLLRESEAHVTINVDEEHPSSLIIVEMHFEFEEEQLSMQLGQQEPQQSQDKNKNGTKNINIDSIINSYRQIKI